MTISQIALPVLPLSCCTYRDIYGFVICATQHLIDALRLFLAPFQFDEKLVLSPDKLSLDIQPEVQAMITFIRALSSDSC